MTRSKFTKASSRKLWVCRLLSFLCNVGPTIGLIIYAFIVGEPSKRFVLGGTIIAALCLLIIGIIRKRMMRSSIWIIALGIYFAINKFLPVISIFAGATLLDELILMPLIDHYKVQLIANKAIDARS